MATKSKTKKTPPRADWSLVPHGPVSGAAVGSLALTAAAMVGAAADASPVWAATGAATGALGLVIEGANRDAGPGALLYRLGCWVGAGGWLTWQWWGEHTLTANGLAALGAGAVGAAALAPLGRIRNNRSQRAGKPGTELVPVQRPGGALGAEWEARFYRVCRVAVEVVGIEHWDNGAGFTLTGHLPPGPATITQIGAATDALATDARLPDGCGVEPPEPGAHRGAFTLRISTRNMLGVRGDEHPPKVHYPADYSPGSLLDPVALGVRRDGSLAQVRLREDSMLVVGPKGGGKTNLLDVTTLGVGRCRDALIWHLDLNGGGMSQFWLHPWLEGKVDRPPIDWAAPNPEEALLMVTVAVEIAKDRKSSYRTFKARNNVKLLPISPELPAIVLMVDESAEALSPRNTDPITTQVRDGLEELLRIGRNEAVFPHFSALRPTQGTIPPDVLTGCAWRLGMFGTSLADLGHLYEWPKGLNANELPVKGTSFFAHKPDAPAPMKAYFLEPEQIQEAAAAISGYRPELDEASAEIANAEYSIRFGRKGTTETTVSGIYAARYERMRAAFTGEPVEVAATTPPAPATRPAAPTSTAPATPQTTSRTASRTTAMAPVDSRSPLPRLRILKGGAAGWPDPMTAAAPAPAAMGGAAGWPDVFPARSTRPAPPPAPKTKTPTESSAVAEVAAPEILARALAAFAAAGDDRMHSETLAEALGFSDAWALAEALRPYGVTTLPNKFTRGGVNKRGYSRQDIAAAASSAAAG